jgi:hypothetical protein
MPDWANTIARRQAGQASGYIGAEEGHDEFVAREKAARRKAATVAAESDDDADGGAGPPSVPDTTRRAAPSRARAAKKG